MMEGNHMKSLTLAPGQDEPVEKSEITSDEKKGGVVNCGPFPIP